MEGVEGLPAAQQIERLAATPSWQTREMFDVVVAAAAAGALEDPWRGEETALVAQALAGLLPRSSCPEPLRHDLLGEVLKVIGNCRRLSGDWPASAAAFAEARGHLDQGTGDRRREARLLSVQASLASDTGKIEQALDLLARATAIHRRAPNAAVVAAITLQEASAFLSGGRYEEAMFQAEESLRELTQKRLALSCWRIASLLNVFPSWGGPRRPYEAQRSLASLSAVPWTPLRALSWPIWKRSCLTLWATLTKQKPHTTTAS